MAYYGIETGTTNRALRAEVVDSMVKQIAEPLYKFKQACAVVTTDSWKNTFFREDPTTTSGPTGNAFKGLPRGAEFPQSSTNWEEVNVKITKFGVQENVPWEDVISGDINVQARSVIRRTREIVKAVDDFIWAGLTQNICSGTSDANPRIQSFAIAASYQWNAASAAILDDLYHASRVLAENNYDTADLLCFVNPRDKQSIMNYMANHGAQWQNIAEGVATNGKIAQLAGITLIESNSVSASYALVLKPKICATIKQLVPLKSDTTEDPFKSVRIRIVEELALELTDPLAVCVIKNTLSA